jgi:hypothetical protein
MIRRWWRRRPKRLPIDERLDQAERRLVEAEKRAMTIVTHDIWGETIAAIARRERHS